VFYGAGIILTLVVYGVLQERIMTQPYGPGGDFFTNSVFLVMCNRFAAVVSALCFATANEEPLGHKAPLWKYLIVSMSNVLASSCQYECLKYVSFAVQMLGKSFKMMPVMLWGILISGKAYGFKDWMVAATVTLGVTEFLMTGPTSSPNSHGSSLYGYLLLLVFLGSDGLTSTLQEKLFKEHKTTKYNQMLYVNLFSAGSSMSWLLATGGLVPALTFSRTHNGFLTDNILLSLSAVVSQWFIYSQVKEFGALVFAATMNVRQVASILVSYATYHHVVTVLQIFGLSMVFGALAYKSMEAFNEAPSADEKKHLQEDIKDPKLAAASKV